MIIRDASPADLPDIARLCAEHAAFERSPIAFDERYEKRLGAALFGATPRAQCLVAEGTVGLAGYAACAPEFSTWRAAEYLHLDCLYLRPEQRHAGIGRRFMETIARRARGPIEWQTPQWNAAAARFYERLGAVAAPKLRYVWNPVRA